MKRLFTMTSKLIAVLLIVFALFSGKTQACDRSSMSLTSYSFNAGTGRWSVDLSLCIGGGQGTPNGADGPTGFCFFFSMVWLSGGSTYDPAYTTPLTITGNNPPNITYEAYGPNYGPPSLGPLFGGDGYPDDDNESYCTTDFILLPDIECISPTVAACGTPHASCWNFHFEFTSLPDTIRAMGIEGSWPFGGCFPNADMRIAFGGLPVLWAGVNAVSENGGVNVNWTTSREKNVSHYRILRSKNQQDFEEIGTLDAAGNSNEFRDYQFFDPNPNEGTNYYKLVEVDLNGNQADESEIVSVFYTPPTVLKLTSVFPSPTNNITTASVFSPEDQSASFVIYDLQGKVILEADRNLSSGVNYIDFDLSTFTPGVYILKMNGKTGVQQLRVVKE